jgi:hypothetical protein
MIAHCRATFSDSPGIGVVRVSSHGKTSQAFQPMLAAHFAPRCQSAFSRNARQRIITGRPHLPAAIVHVPNSARLHQQ